MFCQTMCGAGLTCVKSLGEAVATCIPMQTHCIKTRDKYDQALESGHLGIVSWLWVNLLLFMANTKFALMGENFNLFPNCPVKPDNSL